MLNHVDIFLVKEICGKDDGDCMIATAALKVSIACPLGKCRMTLPCRSSACIHLQCFDAQLFLQMNERKPTWMCPVCDKPLLFESLSIDGYVFVCNYTLWSFRISLSLCSLAVLFVFLTFMFGFVSLGIFRMF